MTHLTASPAWINLKKHYEMLLPIPLKKLFLESNNRFELFSLDAAGLCLDYSKNSVTTETLDLFEALANDRNLTNAVDALFSGKIVNYSEQRSALHTALRMPPQKRRSDVQQELEKIKHYADLLAQKKLMGFTEKPIDTILHVGVGGSGLGPTLYYQALPQSEKKATCHFLNAFDGAAIQSTLAACNPETTIAVIVSKSFTTEETMMVFETIQAWLMNAIGDSQKMQQHLFAVTEKTAVAAAHGFLPHHILKIEEWVGGRYSIWSAVNFACILALGYDNFECFLAGAHAMDQHFQQAPLKKNMPMLMAFLQISYNHFFHAQSKAVVPYTPRLNQLPLYLQQLHMESLGKNVDVSGEQINYPTGYVIWGDAGPNGQHSFHQLLMQGTQCIPIDFILPLRDEQTNEYDIKRAAYCLSQSETLLQGFDEGNAFQKIAGNRPSTTILMDQLTPETLGALLALYEHVVFVSSVIWNINAFDQWGVERGKQVAKKLVHCINEKKYDRQFDHSTQGLLKRVMQRLA